MIQFDYIIFFKWVGEKPPGSNDNWVNLPYQLVIRRISEASTVYGPHGYNGVHHKDLVKWENRAPKD